MAQNDPIGVVFDFDGTLTPKENRSLIKIVENGCLPEPWIKKCDKLSKSYNKNASLNSVLPALERKLINIALRAYQACGLKRDEWMSALREVKLREGVAQKIREITSRGIRVGIISFGVADFIEEVLRRNGLLGVVHCVYAARLVYNSSGIVIGWKKETVVYPLDKGAWSTLFTCQYGIAPERLLAVGDSSGDRTLGIEKHLRLGIAKNEEEAKRIAPFMGKTVVTEDFALVGEWIDEQICLILQG